MALRDVVDNCGDGSRAANPVLRMIDAFTGEKAAFQEKWMSAERIPPQIMHPSHMAASSSSHGPQRQKPVMSIEEFQNFEASEMERDLNRLDMEFGRGMPRGPMGQYRPGGPMGMPQYGKAPPVGPGHMDRYGRPAPRVEELEDEDSKWNDAYAAALREDNPDAEAFAEFDKIYSQGMQRLANMPVPPHHMQQAPLHRDWAKQFEEEEQFAEFEKYYRDKLVPLPPDQQEQLRSAQPTTLPPSESWARQFEEEQKPSESWARQFEDENPTTGGVWAREFEQKFGSEADWVAKYKQYMDNPDSIPDYDTPLDKFDAPFEMNTSLHPSEYTLGPDSDFTNDKDAFEKGCKLFKNGQLTESIQAFEAAVKQDPSHSLAWQMLGSAQAENDRDDLASLALLKAVQADPDNRDAMLTLAVSYTNDYKKDRTLDCLQQWLATNPAYSQVNSDVPLNGEFDQNHRTVTQMFIAAARLRPQDPDPDVQVSLGLLYNLTYDYEKAVDCFKAAARVRPDDYLVWNKLGATLANSRNPQEAIDAYIRALEIKPSYTRAVSNLGIAFMSLSEYGEAAKAFLSALSLDSSATHQWDNLRNVFALMKRPDLIKKCAVKDVSLFSDEFHF